MLIFQGFANSRIVREFPPFSFKVRIATLTRNRVDGKTSRGFESHLLRHIIALFLDGKVRFFSPNFLVDPHAPVG